MRTIAQVDADVARIQNELKDVHGTGTEVYTRIVGYYRSVRNWNKGKREEYNHRKLFVTDDTHTKVSGSKNFIPEVQEASKKNIVTEAQATKEGNLRYELFIRKTCPNCPPVKECCTNLPISGEFVDVDSPEGFARASSLGVFSAPTVIFFDENNQEVERAHSVKEIRSLSPEQVEEKTEAEPVLAMF